MINPDADRVERLKRRLYRPWGPWPRLGRSALNEPLTATARDWSTPTAVPPWWLSGHFLKPLLIGSVVFFFLMVGLVALVFWRGGNSLSAGKVTIKVSGVATVRAGEPATLAVAIANRNEAPIEFVDLIVEYPPGTRAVGSEAPLGRERRPLGTIAAGQTVKESLKFVLFADENVRLPIKINAEYRLANSNAILATNQTHEVTVNSSPVAINLSLPETVNTNQPLTFKVSVRANTANLINQPALLVDYPSGFELKRATPPPSVGRNLWSLNRLAPGDQFDLTLEGVLSGQDNEQKSFRAAVGEAGPDGAALKVEYGSATAVTLINRMPVGLTLKINGESGAAPAVAASRSPVRVEIEWFNNLPTPVTNGELTVALAGAALDKTSVEAGRGLYQSTKNWLVWNQANSENLATLAPGEGGRVSFSFTSLDSTGTELALRDPAVSLALTFRGRRIGEDGESETIETKLTRAVRFSSTAQFSARVLHASGALANRGPLPPKVGEETTYTIVWSVLNSTNDLREASVRAVLPPYLRWLGIQAPANENLAFVPAGAEGGGEVIWNLGVVRAGAGAATAPREVAFQVALRPSLSQVGEAPTLLEAPRFRAVDAFTGAALESEFSRPLDTRLTTDPEFVAGQDKVVE